MYLADSFQVNCSFYYKIGACRHGDRCSRKHVKPSYSQTILLPNLYQNPAYDPKNKMNPSQLQNHFDAFYEDFWCEMCKFGEIEEVVVCDNNNDRSFTFPLFKFLSLTTKYRSYWQCLREIQIRRLGTIRMRRIKFTMVCRTSDILRAITCHRFSRSLLSTQFRRRMC